MNALVKPQVAQTKVPVKPSNIIDVSTEHDVCSITLENGSSTTRFDVFFEISSNYEGFDCELEATCTVSTFDENGELVAESVEPTPAWIDYYIGAQLANDALERAQDDARNRY
jgi:hypothetical protein